jgi:Putative Ig domain
LPKDITFTDNGDGTATIAGTPAAASDLGVYTLNFKAKSSQGTATQAFTLTLNKAPVLNAIASKTAKVGTAFSLNVVSKGYTPAALSAAGLPAGLGLTNNGDGTGSITGTPSVGDGGTYTVTVTAVNPSGMASVSFTMKVTEGPVITSAASQAATIGAPFSFQVTTTGFPAPHVSRSGALPKGITFQAATGTFSGTPKAKSAGTYPITVTAKNSSGSVTQTFTITVS